MLIFLWRRCIRFLRKYFWEMPIKTSTMELKIWRDWLISMNQGCRTIIGEDMRLIIFM
jgi:hypothetical protein